MVFWCKNCGAFLGLREPLTNWKTDRDALCPQCATDPSLRLRDYLTKKPHASSDEVVTALAMVGTKVNVRMVEYVRQFLPAELSTTVRNDTLLVAENEEASLST